MIRGKNIVLRTFKETDLEAYAEIINDLSHATPYWPASLQSESNLRKEFSEGGFWKDDYKILLITGAEDRFIGEVTAFNTSPNIQGPEIAYRIFREDDRKKGYATEAVTLFSAYLFRAEPTILRLTAMTRSDNKASIGMLEKCGFQREGTLRDAEMHGGVPHPYELYSLLRAECPQLEDVIARADAT